MDLAKKINEIDNKNKPKNKFYFKTCKRCRNNFYSTRKRSKICWDCDKRPKWYKEKENNSTEQELTKLKEKLINEYKELI